MYTNSHLTKLWQNLLKDVATKDFYKTDLTNRVNYYTCSGEQTHLTKTKDIDAGVTPMFIPCPVCGARASSHGYGEDKIPDMEPTHEWFRPTLDQVLKKKKEPHLIAHYLGGGLDYRKITTQLKKVTDDTAI